MINYRAEIKGSWVQTAPSTRELAALLGMSTPVGLRDIIERLHMVETVFADRKIHTDDDAAITGRVAFELRSDGSYVFSGHMEATGLATYHYGVQAWVATGDGTAIAAQQTGDVYGDLEPGDARQNWSQADVNPGIAQHWRSLRASHDIGYNMQAEIGGVLGGALDVLTFALKGVLANIVLGPSGWVILVGNELSGMDTKLGAPGTLAGVLVAGGTLMIVGPFGLVPAVVAGAAAASLTDVKDRAMTPHERVFADKVFAGSLDYERIRLTNMVDPTGSGRKFAFPTVGDNILVNIGEAFDNPTTHREPPLPGDPSGRISKYTEPGSLFIHELVHAWQLTHNSLVHVVCNISKDYDYFDTTIGRKADTSWHGRSWGGFKNEEQASIVDDWYGIYRGRLDSFEALNDPAFRFVRDHIWAEIN